MGPLEGGRRALDTHFFLTIAELAVGPGGVREPRLAYRISGHFGMALTVGLVASGISGALPLMPADGVALVVELTMASGMCLRVASSLMGSHATPAA